MFIILTLDYVKILFPLFSNIPSIYIGGMWTGGSRLREERGMSSQRERPFQAKEKDRFWPEAFDRMMQGHLVSACRAAAKYRPQNQANSNWTRRWGRCDWRDRIHFHS